MVSPPELSSLHASLWPEAGGSRTTAQEHHGGEWLSTAILRSSFQRRTRASLGSCALHSTATEQCLSFPALSLDSSRAHRHSSPARCTDHDRSLPTTAFTQLRGQWQSIEFRQYHGMVITHPDAHALFISLSLSCRTFEEQFRQVMNSVFFVVIASRQALIERFADDEAM